MPDAIIIGAGPNGLAAAITLARAGRSVVVYEANETIGGGIRSAELTLPGFVHDICSTVQALTVVSPFFKSMPLEQLGVELIYPDAALAHPLDDEQRRCCIDRWTPRARRSAKMAQTIAA